MARQVGDEPDGYMLMNVDVINEGLDPERMLSSTMVLLKDDLMAWRTKHAFILFEKQCSQRDGIEELEMQTLFEAIDAVVVWRDHRLNGCRRETFQWLANRCGFLVLVDGKQNADERSEAKNADTWASRHRAKVQGEDKNGTISLISGTVGMKSDDREDKTTSDGYDAEKQ